MSDSNPAVAALRAAIEQNRQRLAAVHEELFETTANLMKGGHSIDIDEVKRINEAKSTLERERVYLEHQLRTLAK